MVYFACASAKKYVTEMELAASLCVRFVIKIAHIGVCGATACILGSLMFLRTMLLLSLLHSWLSGVSIHYGYCSLFLFFVIFTMQHIACKRGICYGSYVHLSASYTHALC